MQNPLRMALPAALAVLLVAGSSLARAQARLAPEPANPRASIVLVDDQVLVVPNQPIFVEGNVLKVSELTLELECPSGTMTRAEVATMAGPASPVQWTDGRSQRTHTWSDVGLHSGQAMKWMCPQGQVTSGVVIAVPIEVFVSCQDGGTVQQHRAEFSYPTRAVCDQRDGGKSRVSPGTFRHTCPEGLVVENSADNSVTSEDGWNRPKVCQPAS